MQPAPQRGCLPVLLRLYNIIAIIGLGLAALFLLYSIFFPKTYFSLLAIDSDLLNLAGMLLVLISIQAISLVRVNRTQYFTVLLPEQKVDLFKIASWALIGWVFVILLGQYLAARYMFKFLLPLLNILAIGLPIWWLFELGRRKLVRTDALTTQGSLSLGTTLIPILAIAVELFALYFFFLLVFSNLKAQPGFMELFRTVVQQQGAGFSDQQSRQFFGLVFQNPLTIVFILIFICGIVPLIEEFFKPLGILLFANEKPTPAQGFVLGMLCGAAFGFLESVMALSDTGSNWYMVVLLRAAAGLLHMVATGITGWGYAVAVNGKGPWRAFLALLASVGLHAVWNLFAILASLLPLIATEGQPISTALKWAGTAAPVILVLLTVGMLVFLIRLNRRFRKSIVSQPVEPAL